MRENVQDLMILIVRYGVEDDSQVPEDFWRQEWCNSSR